MTPGPGQGTEAGAGIDGDTRQRHVLVLEAVLELEPVVAGGRGRVVIIPVEVGRAQPLDLGQQVVLDTLQALVVRPGIEFESPEDVVERV